ncbi:hypothetical protein HDU77_010708 [Chytriomyces hyalinus]|nr:hypothetical protein HDU77_010708 [Chytriomyces hyalinus]
MDPSTNNNSNDSRDTFNTHFTDFPSYNDWHSREENQRGTVDQYHDELYAHGLHLYNDRKQPDAAIAIFTYLANREHAGGMNAYGVRLVEGDTPGAVRDRPTGFTWVEKSAKLGFAKAQGNLASYLSSGTGCEQNNKEALRWGYMAIEGGYVEAYSVIGTMYMQGEGVEVDHFKAVELYQRGVDLGSIDCIAQLGLQYQLGCGVTKNVHKAVELFEKAVGLGDLLGCYYLGCLYIDGDDGIPPDLSKGIKNYERAAQGDIVAAIRNLGNCYERGNGVPQNYETALQFFMRAANSEDSWALYYLGAKYQNGTGVPQDYAKAYEYYERAAKRKHKQAICNVGFLLSAGLGCTKDMVRAAELYQQAAALGDPTATHNLGCVFENGEGVPINLLKALDYYRKAVELNYDLAKPCLLPNSRLATSLCAAGKVYRAEGKTREAGEHFLAAAQLGHAQAVEQLSALYADALWGMDEVSFDAEMRFFTPPQMPDTTLSILPSELLTQIFSWLHPKQCILLRRTSHRMLAFFDTESFARHLLQVNALFLPSPVQKLENWLDKMLFHGPHAFQVAYIEARLNGLQIITGAEVKYASGSDCRMKEFPAAFVHWTSLTCLQLSRCELTGAIPGSIKYLRSLREVDLSHNRFDGTEIPATSIMEFDNLEVLLLNACGLTGKVGLEFLAFLERLKQYSLGSNELEFETKFKPAKIEHVLE